jgi:hypothetical protein
MTLKPPPLLRWDIYRAAAKAKWIGEVEATDERAMTTPTRRSPIAFISMKPPLRCRASISTLRFGAWVPESEHRATGPHAATQWELPNFTLKGWGASLLTKE